MGDNDGSSGAAQSAQSADDTPKQGGIFARMIGALGATDSPETAPDVPVATNGTAEHGMINLRRLRVEDVAIPSADIVSISVTASKDDLVKVFKDTGKSRVPVYDGTLDNPVGFVHLKDFALKHGFNGGGGDFDLKGLLRPLLFVPPSMPVRTTRR